MDSDEPPPSQETFQATQVDGEDDSWSDGSQPTPGELDGVWGRLVNLGGGDTEWLAENDEPAEQGGTAEFNEHIMGRNVDLSDIIVDFDRRISGKHCRLFCEAAAAPPGFDERAAAASSSSSGAPPPALAREHFRVYVQNLSSNGTFVNNVKLKEKGERRLLHNGDEIALLKPKDNKPNKGTFTFVNLRQRNVNASDGAHDRLSTGPLAGGAMLDASAVPHYPGPATGDGRNVHDFYTFTNDFLGEGNYGKVTRVVEKATGTHWACKEIDMKKAFMHGTTKEQMLNEFNIMKNLDTPLVIKSKEYFNTADSKLLFILELIEGNDLFERIVRSHTRGYPERLARTLMANVLEAVRFLHDKNIVHRDLKPENIMLVTKESDTEMKLTDFGLAKAEAQCKTFCGTPQYYAPEVLKRQQTMLHQGRYGPPADMWSVGVILYVVLSGTPAFKGEGLDQKIHNGTYAPMVGERWSNVSESAKDLVRKLLTVSEAERLTAAQAQAHEWFRQEGASGAADEGVRAGAEAGSALKRGRDDQPDDSDDSPAHRAGKKAKPNLRTEDATAVAAPALGPLDAVEAAAAVKMGDARRNWVTPHSL